MVTHSRQLAEFAAGLEYGQIPEAVAERVLWLFLDWYGSALAGSASRTTGVLKAVASEMGPRDGPCRVLGHDCGTSPMFAAMINGASSHVVEQDDLHNSSIFHPATVVFPPIFAVAQSNPEISGRDFITAAAAGYECGIRVGEFLGPSHYKVFHITATAGTIAAAMAAARLLKLDGGKTLHALGSAGTQAGGLWEFLKDAADSKQLHTAQACANGLLAAYTARKGLTAAGQILEGDRGMAAGMLGEGDARKITDRLYSRWALVETSFKFHASCRHTHPAADALLDICRKKNIDYKQINAIRVFVYRAAKDVLSAVDVPKNVHQSKFSMGFVLALIARRRSAGVADFTDEAVRDPENAALREKVSMTVDGEIEAAYPKKWGSKVQVTMNSGEIHESFVDTPKGDPENMLSQEELERKAIALAQYGGASAPSAMMAVIEKIRRLPDIHSFAAEFQ